MISEGHRVIVFFLLKKFILVNVRNEDENSMLGFIYCTASSNVFPRPKCVCNRDVLKDGLAWLVRKQPTVIPFQHSQSCLLGQMDRDPISCTNMQIQFNNQSVPFLQKSEIPHMIGVTISHKSCLIGRQRKEFW